MRQDWHSLAALKEGEETAEREEAHVGSKRRKGRKNGPYWPRAWLLEELREDILGLAPKLREKEPGGKSLTSLKKQFIG